MKSHPTPFGWTTRSRTGGEADSEIDAIHNDHGEGETSLNSSFLWKEADVHILESRYTDSCL
jgi:hypothetical protein